MFDLYILLCLDIFCWIDLIICQVFNLAQDFLSIDWMAREDVLYILMVDKGDEKLKPLNQPFSIFCKNKIFPLI